MSKIGWLVLVSASCTLAAGSTYTAQTDQELLDNYRQLRTVTPDPHNSFVLENAAIDTGSGTFRFTSGMLYLLAPVGGRVSGAVFLGDGSFSLKPPDESEGSQLRRFTGGRPDLEEPFRELVFVATDDTLTKLVAGLNARPAPELSKAANVLEDFRKLFRDTLRTNIEARLVAGFCSPRERLLVADIRGRKQGRFVFIIDPQSEDEVQLLRQADRNAFDVWTSFHLPGDQGPAARALVDSLASKIDVTIEKSGKLSGSAEIEFTSLADGARLLHVRLAPSLRVSRMAAGAPS